MICVGNPTVGGTGKTPTALAIARTAKRMGYRPGFVSRGYGRKSKGGAPIVVDPGSHSAGEVGDESILLASEGATAVAVDRASAARLLIADGCDLIVMDDGFQSRRLFVDESLLVIDRAAGIGNGQVLPAGPLRMPLATQLTAANTLIVIDSGGTPAVTDVTRAAARAGCRIVRAESGLDEPERWRGRSVVAFCGLGDPSKFARALERSGANVVAQWNFADHHAYSLRDMRALAHLAIERGGDLVTTEKDAARLRHIDHDTAFEVAKLKLEFEPQALEAIVGRAVAAYQRRRR